jgi:integrase
VNQARDQRGAFFIPSYQHASVEDYLRGIQGGYPDRRHIQHLLRFREQFVQRYPDLRGWFDAPLAERVGRLHGEDPYQATCRVSYKARPYLIFLALYGSIQLDWEWIIAIRNVQLEDLIERVHVDVGLEKLIEEAVALGYSHTSATKVLRWGVSRLLLYTGLPHVEAIQEAHLDAFLDAAARFSERSDVALFYGSNEQYLRERKAIKRQVHTLRLLLYHRGQILNEPHIRQWRPPREVLKPRMEEVLARYLDTRRLTYQPSTLRRMRDALRQLMAWLAQVYPDLETFAEVTREHVIEFAVALHTMVGVRTKRPFAPGTIRTWLGYLSLFFQDVASWRWKDVPETPLLQAGDLRKQTLRVPRYIPDEELARLMSAIRQLPCPYQRGALLIARWSGARRDEIRRLSVDCLDQYPDGTARLRLPAGKTYQERMIPIHHEAAEAIRLLQKQRKGERGLRDPKTGVETRYLFMHHGKLYSYSYLFEEPLLKACTAAGLITADGKATVTAHRFRHTVGTQLARRGARLRTIQKVLGHESVRMASVYIGITDEEVCQDYQAALESGNPLAGPAAASLQAGKWSASEMNWLKSNYWKTELELGHCLRLPEEGPCECDLYLFCAKFLTTRQKAPRLRHRRKVELLLAGDAAARGWAAEVGRHQRFAARCEELLANLGEPLDGPEATD